MSYSYQKNQNWKKHPLCIYILSIYLLLETILIFQILFFMSSIGSYFYYYFNFSLSSLLITLTKRSSKEAGPGLGKNIFDFSFLFDKWNLYIILWSICFIYIIYYKYKKNFIEFFLNVSYLCMRISYILHLIFLILEHTVLKKESLLQLFRTLRTILLNFLLLIHDLHK